MKDSPNSLTEGYRPKWGRIFTCRFSARTVIAAKTAFRRYSTGPEEHEWGGMRSVRRFSIASRIGSAAGIPAEIRFGDFFVKINPLVKAREIAFAQ